MPLETANYIYDLVASNPPDTDLVQQGDDHIRLLKKVIQQTWPSLTGPSLPTSTGSANAHIVTHVYGPAAYSAGQIVTFKAGFTNTGPTTINVNGGGAVTLALGGAALAANALVAGNVYTMIYDPALTAFSIIASSGTLGLYLPLTGGTLSGVLTLAPPSGPVQLILNKSASGLNAGVFGQMNGATRWAAFYGNTNAEGGSNTGSDFVIGRYSDTGTAIDNPLTITRSTGNVTIANSVTHCQLFLNKPVGAFVNAINGQRNGVNRWQFALANSTAETGSNTGSDVVFTRYDDTGNPIDSPLTITRSSGQVTLGQQLNLNNTLQMGANGVQCGGRVDRSGTSGANGSFFHNFFWTGSAMQVWTGTTNAGNITLASDYRIKRDIAPLPSMWDHVKALKPISYRHKDWSVIKGDDVERWGFVAHELQETLIEDAATGKKDEENVIQSPNLMAVVAALTKALQEAMARIENLETQLGVQHG